MTHAAWHVLGILAAVVVAFALFLGLCAIAGCMLSSRITRRIERENAAMLTERRAALTTEANPIESYPAESVSGSRSVSSQESVSNPPSCLVCGKVATTRDIDGDWWPPCEHAKRFGLATLTFESVSFNPLGASASSLRERA